jgi:hypothetical protein
MPMIRQVWLHELEPAMTPANDHNRASAPALGEAVWMKSEVNRFESSFSRSPQTRTPLPVWTWEQLERQLVSLSSSPSMAAVTPELISAVRKQSRWLPPEMVLREILCAAFACMDGDFSPPSLPRTQGDD